MDSVTTHDIIVNRLQKHRNFLRFPLTLPAKCILNVGETPARCRLVDISEQGLGLEVDALIRMRDGQLVLLKIDIDPQQPPVNAITELTWVRRRKNGSELQRAGSRLLLIDPGAKQLLLERAYAAVISRITRGGPA